MKSENEFQLDFNGFSDLSFKVDPDPYVSTVHRQVEAAQWAMVFINTTGDKLCVGAVAGERGRGQIMV